MLAVLADHLLEYVGGRIGVEFHPADWRIGRVGVLLFFVHTSYVLMLSLQRLHAGGGNVFLNFMVRRIFRIFPLSIIAITVMLAFRIPAMGWMGDFTAPTATELLANLALVQNLTYSRDILAPLWSLPLEVQMYLTLPLLFVLVTRQPAVRTVAVLWVLAVAAALVQPLFAGRLTVAQFGPCFVAGIVAYVLSGRDTPRLPSWAWPPALAALVIAYLGVAGATTEVHPPAVAWAMCLATGLLVPCFHDIRQTHVARAAHLLARYSYGIYLSHIILMWVVFVQLPPMSPWLQGVALLALLVVVPVACYHLVEEPFLRFGALLAERLARRPAAVTPSAAHPLPAAAPLSLMAMAPRRAAARTPRPSGQGTSPS